MSVKFEREYYGADADGNRGIWINYCEFYSDISGDELDPNDLWRSPNGDLCSKEELIKELRAKKRTATEVLKCSCCDEQIETGEDYYEVDNEVYHEDCFEDMIYDNYHTDEDSVAEEESDRIEGEREDRAYEEWRDRQLELELEEKNNK